MRGVWIECDTDSGSDHSTGLGRQDISSGSSRAWLRTLHRTLSNAPQDVMIRPKPAHDTDCITYRCFLPDLTGFVTACCVVPDLGQPLAHGIGGPQKGIRPRIKRISGNRTPLAPRLAQPSDPCIAYAGLHFNSKRSATMENRNLHSIDDWTHPGP